MTVKQLKQMIKKYPDDMMVKIMPHHDRDASMNHVVQELNEEHFLVSSEKAWIDDEADPETWDTEEGKIRHKGKKYLLLNPIIQ